MESAAKMNPTDAPTEMGRERLTLLRRLSDVVGLPGSRINAFERSVVADLLIEVLRQAPLEERARVASRLSQLTEIPNNLCRMLLRDDIEVASRLIDDNQALNDFDLMGCASEASLEHCKHIAMRRPVSAALADALISRNDVEVMMLLLANDFAVIPMTALEKIVACSRFHPELCAAVLKRPELRPSSAYMIFWWCNAAERSIILRRFAVSREVLQNSVSDMFKLAFNNSFDDPVVLKALQFIERRQRRRDLADASPHGGLEGLIKEASLKGMTPEIVAEIGHLAGIRPLTAAKILSDEGGEALAVLCKATGLARQYLAYLWKAMRYDTSGSEDVQAERWERVQVTYEMLAVDRAQTVIRYWNWALTSALTPDLIRAIREGEDHLIDEFSAAERAALLALGPDLRTDKSGQ